MGAKRKRTAVQSANKKEFDRIRRNIIARMKYRQKQGFKVDYSTKPVTMASPTKRDIEKLKKYDVKLNKYGEVVASRPTREANQFRSISRADVVQAKQFVKNENDYVSRETSIGTDKTTMIDHIKSEIEKVRNSRGTIDYYVNNDVAFADDMSGVFNLIADLLLQRIDLEIQRNGVEKVEAYYTTREADIMQELNNLSEAWYEDEAMASGAELEQLLQVP